VEELSEYTDVKNKSKEIKEMHFKYFWKDKITIKQIESNK
jgi:hypothetical protein